MARRYGLSFTVDVATASGCITVSRNTGFEKCRLCVNFTELRFTSDDAMQRYLADIETIWTRL